MRELFFSCTLLLSVAAFAEKPQPKPKFPTDFPSRHEPRAKSCSGRCEQDNRDCGYICKNSGNNPQCQSMCRDSKKQCLDRCDKRGRK